VNRRWQIAVSVAVAAAAAGFGLTAALRVHDMKQFTRRHQVQSAGGTNYVVAVAEMTVGRIDNGYVAIVYLRWENPNPFEITLSRDSFKLIDSTGKSYAASSAGTQSSLIKLPAGSVIERDMLSFLVQHDVFAGALELELQPGYRLEVKDGQPFRDQLRIGEFRAFHRRGW
jgi:hypothetical protein